MFPRTLREYLLSSVYKDCNFDSDFWYKLQWMTFRKLYFCDNAFHLKVFRIKVIKIWHFPCWRRCSLQTNGKKSNFNVTKAMADLVTNTARGKPKGINECFSDGVINSHQPRLLMEFYRHCNWWLTCDRRTFVCKSSSHHDKCCTDCLRSHILQL